MNCSILIVLYNSSLCESLTITSLFQAERVEDIELTLSIWNNGPTYLSNNDIDKFKEQAACRGIKVEIFEDIRNIALSKIYNFILKHKGHDFSVIFDHDSIIPADFFKNLLEYKSFDLIVPFIFDKNSKKIEYPVDSKSNSVIEKKGAVDISGLMSIGSGLVLSARLIELFNKHNMAIFNENFAFYGVDSMFFRSMWSLSNKEPLIKIACANCIIHSRSMNELEPQDIKEKRKLERLYDSTLVQLHYSGKSRYSVFKKTIRKFRKREININSLCKIIRCIFYKKHPRSHLKITHKRK